MRIRAVVLAYDGGDDLERSVASLLAARDNAAAVDPDLELQVVVVDNASRDGSVERISDFHSEQISVVANRENLGFPGVNTGLADLEAVDAVFLLNQDAWVENDTITLLADLLASDPGIGAACPKLLFEGRYREVDLSPLFSSEVAPVVIDSIRSKETDCSFHVTGPGSGRVATEQGTDWFVAPGSTLRVRDADHVVSPLQMTVRRVEGNGGSAGPEAHDVPVDSTATHVIQNAGSLVGPDGAGINRCYLEVDRGDQEQVDVIAWCGAGVLLRSEYLRQVGLFDQRFFLYYEDIDLSWRGSRSGWRYRYEPAAVVHHRHSVSAVHGSALYDRLHTRNRLLAVTMNGEWRLVGRAWSNAFRLLMRTLVHETLGQVKRGRVPRLTMTIRYTRGVAGAVAGLPSALLARRRRMRK